MKETKADTAQTMACFDNCAYCQNSYRLSYLHGRLTHFMEKTNYIDRRKVQVIRKVGEKSSDIATYKLIRPRSGLSENNDINKLI